MIRLIALLLAALPSFGAIAYVNSVATAGTTMGALNVTAGNMLFACALYQTGGASVTATDTAGNTYVALPAQVRGTDFAYGVWCFYALSVTGNASNVVTFAGPFIYEGAVSQYSGVATSSALDVTNKGAGGNAITGTTQSFTTTTANQLILLSGPAENWALVSTDVGGTAGTVRVTAPNGTVTIADRIVSSIQTGITASMTNINQQKFAVVVFSFKEAAATGRRRISVIQ